jgi:dienelactone hydrolase
MRTGLLTLFVLTASLLRGQASPQQVSRPLAQTIQPSDLVEFQLRQYLLRYISKPAAPRTAAEWTSEAQRLRSHVLNDIIFHGWPKQWITAPLKYEEAGVIETGKGYRMRKLRYEIVPGFWTTAISYEPASLSGKVPAVLNVHGHGKPGKAFEFKQKRCINYALRGMIALSPEWFAFGELDQEGNSHDYGAHLELAGVNPVGLFYLAMRKGLDYLYDNPSVDRNRLAVTGLSGGGWQTIVLSALDERVKLSMPVAGYEPLDVNIVHPNDTADVEQESSDFRAGQDYTHLTAMLAPRPALLMFNAEDNCCFRAPMVKEGVYDSIKPFYSLYGKAESLAWHENLDPGTHNYQLDNREQSYRFLAKHFGLSAPDREIPVDSEVKSEEELTVGLPKDNLTILELARRFAADIHRDTLSPQDARTRLESIVRYKPVSVAYAWMVDSFKNKGVESRSYQLLFNNGLSAAAVWFKSMAAPDNAPVTIMLNDDGRKALSGDVSERVNRGEQVLAIDLLFTGDEKPQRPSAFSYALLLTSVGERPIGMEAAQLLAAATWLTHSGGQRSARIAATGPRSQLASLIAAAITPSLFSRVIVRKGMPSLASVFKNPVKFRDAPDLFCEDLYKVFDIDSIAVLSAPATVQQTAN